MKRIFLILFVGIFFGCEQRRAPEVREFPTGFHGWAIIVWNAPGYPPLPTDHGKLIERFPDDGILITSTKPQFGWAHDESYFVDTSGKRTSFVPSDSFGGTGTIDRGTGQTMQYSRAFIGTQAQRQSAPPNPPLEEAFKRLYQPAHQN